MGGAKENRDLCLGSGGAETVCAKVQRQDLLNLRLESACFVWEMLREGRQGSVAE